jgi:gliding motility-associated-like protein
MHPILSLAAGRSCKRSLITAKLFGSNGSADSKTHRRRCSVAGPVALFLIMAFAGGETLHAQFTLNGSTTDLGGDCFRLTPNLTGQVGTLWYTDLIDLSEPFRVEADIFLGFSDGGADGLAFVLQPLSTGAGTSGGSLGYAGISPSAIVEFDTYQNGANGDPFCDHTALLTNGDPVHTAGTAITPPVQASSTACNIEDGAFHSLSVRWDPALTRLEVYVDCALRIDATVDLTAAVFGGDPNVYWGFTGATGGLSNEHRVCVKFYDIDLPVDTVSLCDGDSAVLEAPAGFSGYTWSPAFGLDDPTSATPIASPSVSTTYVAAFVDPCGEVFTDTVHVEVGSGPVFDLGPDTTLCNGASLVLNTPPGATSVLWPDGSSGPSFSINTAGSYAVEASIGLCPSFDTIEVAVANPVADAGADLSACTGDSVLVDVLPDPGVALGWSLDGLPVGVGGNAWLSTPGTYILTAVEGPCFQQDSLVFSEDPLPQLLFQPDSVAWCPEASVVLQPISDAESFVWDDGQTSASITVDMAGSYAVTASLDGCVSEASVLVYERDDCSCNPSLPNAFSPNGDGMNDVFRVLFVEGCPNLSDFDLWVFNRWGQLVFAGGDPTTGWDGSFKGQPAELGSYVFQLRYTNNGQVQVEQGNLTLVR